MGVLPELIGAEEAARILRVSRTNLKRDVPELPPALHERQPAGSLASSYPIYERAAIERLARERAGRKPSAR
jgi:hypothetical protein